MISSGHTPGLRVLLLFVFMTLSLSAGLVAQEPETAAEKTAWEKFKSFFKEEKELPPAKKLFQQAEEFYHGRETWWGKLVRKTGGKDSKAYKTWWGIKLENYTRARDFYQKLADNYPYSKYTPIAELRLAGCSYELEEYEDASFRYEQFRLLHPRHEKVSFALFREAMCHYHQMLKPGRDQTQTRDAIKLFNRLLAEYPGNDYIEEAGKKREECRLHLIKHEFRVAKFYFKRKEYWAAAGRYRGVWESYTGLGRESEAMYKEALCYEKLGKDDLAREMYKRAAKVQPENEYAMMAKEKLDGISEDKEETNESPGP